MKSIIYIISIFCSLSFSLKGNSEIKFDRTLEAPSSELCNDRESSSIKLRFLFKQGDLLDFYKEVIPLLNFQEELDEKLKKEQQWIIYYLSGIPLLDMTSQETVSKCSAALLSVTADIDIKFKIASTILSSYYINTNNLASKKRTKKLIENIKYCAVILKTFKESYKKDIKLFPLLSQQTNSFSSFNNSQKNKSSIKNIELSETISRASSLNSRNNINKYRKKILEQNISLLEKNFVEVLSKYLNGKYSEVLKYIKLSGYEDHEITELLDRTVGRNNRTEFLYKGRYGSEHDRKNKSSHN